MGNTLKFSGYAANKTPSANMIWAFTPGESSTNGWLSDDAPNYMTLVRDLQSGVKAKKRIVLAVPVNSPNKTDEFTELLDPKTKWKKETFTIRVYDPSAQAYLESFLLKNVARIGEPIPESNGTSWAYTVLKLKVAGEVVTKPDYL